MSVSLLGEDSRRALRERWNESSRHYHGAQHLDECLALFDQYRGLARDADAVEAALWLHDAIYDARAGDNEARSAALAREMLSAEGVDAARIAQVEAMILATTHAAISADRDTRLLCDIDLAVLGATPERFAEYERQVREEYAWVPGLIYGRTRAKILERFLERPSIYQVPELAARFEATARTNLRDSIAALRG